MGVLKFVGDIKRVWKVTKKPSKKDYMLTVKVVSIGFLIIGLIGFLMEILWHLLLRRIFI